MFDLVAVVVVDADSRCCQDLGQFSLSRSLAKVQKQLDDLLWGQIDPFTAVMSLENDH